MWSVQNADGSYTTSFVGLASGITTTNFVSISPVFELGGNIQMDATTNRTWWGMGEKLIDKNGFVDARFANLPTRTIEEAAGGLGRYVTSTMYYEQGVGLWIRINAKHNVLTNGWAGNGFDLELQVGTKTYWLYYNSGAAQYGGGFDMTKSTIDARQSGDGTTTAKYTTLMIGFIPDEKLLEAGITQDSLNEGIVDVNYVKLKSPNEGLFTTTAGTQSGTSTDLWNIHGAVKVGTQGYIA